MNKAIKKRKGGSTAVTAILINCETLVVANVGDSRAVLCQDGAAKQLSVDHEPNKERKVIEEKGGFVTKFPGVYQTCSNSTICAKHVCKI